MKRMEKGESKMKFDEVTLVQVVESLRILQAICKVNDETCETCLFYNPNGTISSCMFYRQEDGCLADAVAAMRRIGGLQIKRGEETLAVKYTNGDRIRDMTDDEMADFLESGQANACIHCDEYDKEKKRCTFNGRCKTEFAVAALYDWLSSPADQEPEEIKEEDYE